FLIAPGERHLLGSNVQLAPMDAGTKPSTAAAAGPDLVHLRHGGSGTVTRFVCGYLAFSRAARPLLDALPRALRIRVGDGPTSTLLRHLLREGVRESTVSRPGAESMLAKLSELMFVEAIRH